MGLRKRRELSNLRRKMMIEAEDDDRLVSFPK
jgi:hypothetical protein